MRRWNIGELKLARLSDREPDHTVDLSCFPFLVYPLPVSKTTAYPGVELVFLSVCFFVGLGIRPVHGNDCLSIFPG